MNITEPTPSTSTPAPARPDSRRFALPAAWLVVVALVAVAPMLGMGPYWSRQVVIVCILSLVTSGLVLSFGYAGELSFGQAAVYAAGAYVGGWMAVNVLNDLLFVLLVAAIAGTIVGLLAGIPGLRLGGWMLGVASFFLVILVPDVVQWFPQDALGGYSGLTGIPSPSLLGTELTSEGFYVAVIVVTAAWFVVFRNLGKSRFGTSLLVMKESPVLAASLGLPVYYYKLGAYAIGALPAGLAGALFAYLDGYVAPESFTLQVTLSVLAACILGGTTSIYGTIAGVGLLQLALMRLDAFKDYQMIAYGAFLVLGGALLRDGIGGLITTFARRLGLLRRPPLSEVATPEALQVPGKLLRVSGLAKHFGGVYAVRDVDFEAKPGQITALIGPNGSGKTTILNLISGLHRADAGSITLGQGDRLEELVGRRPFEVARRGVARTFQTPAIPKKLTVGEVMTSARVSVNRVTVLETALRLPRYLRAVRHDRAKELAALSRVGLTDRFHDKAADLALGTRRMLELARAMVREPSVILLDEVASGLDVDDVAELDAILRQLRDAGATVILVEHNFTLVKSIADHVVVLAEGKVITSGPPGQVEADPDVRRHYLGESVELSGTSLRSTEVTP